MASWTPTVPTDGPPGAPTGATTATPTAWGDAALAAALLAIDPAGLGGVSLRGGAGPVRDRWLALLRAELPPDGPWRRVPHNAGDDGLLGGLDLAATLRAGRPIAHGGVLAAADGGVVVLAMAERVSSMTAARLAAALDDGAVVLQRDGLSLRLPARFGLVALDEGLAEDEYPPSALLDRLAFHVDLGLVDARAGDQPIADPATIAAARARLAAVRSRSATLEAPDIIERPDAAEVPRGAEAAHAAEFSGVAEAPHAAKILRAAAVSGAGEVEHVGEVQDVEPLQDVAEALCAAAMALGVASLRAPILALRVATAAAALHGRLSVTVEDAAIAARLVLAPRATRLPEAPPPDQAPPDAADPEASDTSDPNPPASDTDQEADPTTATDQPLADIVLEAAQAALPPDVLARLLAGGSPGRVRSIGRAGTDQRSLRRGRPIGVAAGELRMGARLHLVETLKAAAPWQRLRQVERDDAGRPGDYEATSRGQYPSSRDPVSNPEARRLEVPRLEVRRLDVRRTDFRLVRFRHRSQTLTIFVVDASGSSALHRLAEAKGAVERLLADCYVRRDKVALIAFRGRDAELLLPPTSALARAKRCLASLPGGGGTPLAAGLDAAALLADAANRKGLTPILTLLTDGRANVAADGSFDRARAEADVIAAARRIRAAGFATLLIDTAPRPDERTTRLGGELGARYLKLPRADAIGLSAVIRETVATAGRAAGRPAGA